jgi:hypothetical protein
MSASGRFNLSSWTLRHQALVTFILALTTLLGIGSYSRLSQSEDPPFTFKVMVIQTDWPGATARQVQEQITDRVARKLQLFASRPIAIVFYDQGHCARQPGAKNLVSGTQESRRHRGNLARRRQRSLFQ